MLLLLRSVLLHARVPALSEPPAVAPLNRQALSAHEEKRDQRQPFQPGARCRARRQELPAPSHEQDRLPAPRRRSGVLRWELPRRVERAATVAAGALPSA